LRCAGFAGGGLGGIGRRLSASGKRQDREIESSESKLRHRVLLAEKTNSNGLLSHFYDSASHALFQNKA
jgi:hypothetical protein